MLYETLITKTKEELDQEQVDNRVIQAQARLSKAISTAIEECSLARVQINQAWLTNPLNPHGWHHTYCGRAQARYRANAA